MAGLHIEDSVRRFVHAHLAGNGCLDPPPDLWGQAHSLMSPTDTCQNAALVAFEPDSLHWDLEDIQFFVLPGFPGCFGSSALHSCAVYSQVSHDIMNFGPISRELVLEHALGLDI